MYEAPNRGRGSHRTKGQCMRRVSLGSLVPALTVALALIVAGCGGSSSSEKGGGDSAAPGGANLGSCNRDANRPGLPAARLIAEGRPVSGGRHVG